MKKTTKTTPVKLFEEVYKEKGLFFETRYYTNFYYLNKNGELELHILRIDYLTYLRKVNEK